MTCAGISEPIANSGWRRSARSPVLRKNSTAISPRDHHGRIQADNLAHLDRISKSKDTRHAWSAVRFISGRESKTTGKSLLYKGRVHASECAKASSFVQEYARISGHKGDKDSMEVDLQCTKRSTPITLRQQIEEAFTTVNFSCRFLN